MRDSAIEMVALLPIRIIMDERGMVEKLPQPPFSVADVYATTVRKDMIKGWHGYHTKTLMFCVVSGMVKLVVWDVKGEVVEQHFLDAKCGYAVVAHPGIFTAFKGMSDEDAVLVVQADERYSDAGVIRVPPDACQFYDWEAKNG